MLLRVSNMSLESTHQNENGEVEIKSYCVVCLAEVVDPFDLVDASILCPDCTLRNVARPLVKEFSASDAEQKRIRQQGRDACCQNIECFATNSQMPHFNPYEPLSEEWQLWKDGYFESLVNQEQQNGSRYPIRGVKLEAHFESNDENH
jgi:hypothetical protein